jgi:hypothetical protein
VRSVEALLVVAALAMATRADAEPCEDALAISLFESRFVVAPRPTEGVGLDLAARAIGVTWGQCRGLRHRIEALAYEAPAYGTPAASALHLGRYQLAWHGRDWSGFVALRPVTVWGGDVRFVTPAIGLRVWLDPDLLTTVTVESAGVFAASLDRKPRHHRDLAIEAALSFPARARTRAELRARLREYRFDQVDVTDITAIAGVGWALAARDGMRGMPGLLGFALRTAETTQVLVVVELGLGVGPY